jgi:hypothetical protein
LNAVGVGFGAGTRGFHRNHGDALDAELGLGPDDIAGLGAAVEQAGIKGASRVEGARCPPGPSAIGPRAGQLYLYAASHRTKVQLPGGSAKSQLRHQQQCYFVTVTKRQACVWCGGAIEISGGAGRPRHYCRRSCRQRDFEARKRARELGLAESDLIVARQAMEGLDDLLFVLGCAIADVEGDLVLDGSPDQLQRSLDWLLESARPLLGASERLRGAS